MRVSAKGSTVSQPMCQAINSSPQPAHSQKVASLLPYSGMGGISRFRFGACFSRHW